MEVSPYTIFNSIPGGCNRLRRLRILARMGIWDKPVSADDAAAWLRMNPGFVQSDLLDSDNATAQTVQYMCALVARSLSYPVLAAAWRDAWEHFRFIAGFDEPTAIWWYARYLIKFVHHQKLLVDWMGLPNELQLLISPEALLRLREPVGDCAVFTTLIGALLAYRGWTWHVVTVAVNPLHPDLYTHVYPEVVRPDGEVMALDASHGKYPGWRAPDYRILKKKCGALQAMNSPLKEETWAA